MTFQPGHPKFGGRRRGSFSLKTEVVRNVVESVLNQSIPERLLQLAQLDPEREIDVLLALMPYCYPRFAQLDISAQLEGQLKDIENATDGELLELMKKANEVVQTQKKKKSLPSSPSPKAKAHSDKEWDES